MVEKVISVPIEDLRTLTEWAAVGTKEMIYKVHLSNGGGREVEDVVKRCGALIAAGHREAILPWKDAALLTDFALAGMAGICYKVHLSNGGKPVTVVKKYSIRFGLEPDIPPQAPVVLKQDSITDNALKQSEALANQPARGHWR